jgi:hypothetical protein
MIAVLAIGFYASVGYSDSHEIKKDSFQVDSDHYAMVSVTSIDLSAERPADLIVDAPYLGRPATQHVEVSEELTDVFEMRIRPPPEKVQKSEYTTLKI